MKQLFCLYHNSDLNKHNTGVSLKYLLLNDTTWLFTVFLIVNSDTLKIDSEIRYQLSHFLSDTKIIIFPFK